MSGKINTNYEEKNKESGEEGKEGGEKEEGCEEAQKVVHLIPRKSGGFLFPATAVCLRR